MKFKAGDRLMEKNSKKGTYDFEVLDVLQGRYRVQSKSGSFWIKSYYIDKHYLLYIPAPPEPNPAFRKPTRSIEL